MREIRLSGLMRGGEFTGELTTAVGLILIGELSAYSTELSWLDRLVAAVSAGSSRSMILKWHGSPDPWVRSVTDSTGRETRATLVAAPPRYAFWRQNCLDQPLGRDRFGKIRLSSTARARSHRHIRSGHRETRRYESAGMAFDHFQTRHVGRNRGRVRVLARNRALNRTGRARLRAREKSSRPATIRTDISLSSRMNSHPERRESLAWRD